MRPNPVLRRLGFTDRDRVVIIHTDDIGMCQASVQAFADLHDFGLISSGAVMATCPWFLAAAAFAREHPEVDLGVHLTLTSEWENYRWGPLSTREFTSGLIDRGGYFHRTTEQAREQGQAEAVRGEIFAQVERVLASGMKPTHIDTHMGVVACAKFLKAYLQTAIYHCLPPMIFRMDEAGWRAAGLDPETARMATVVVAQLEELGMPLLDHLAGTAQVIPEDRLEQVKAEFSVLKAGITHFIIHPSVDTPELRAITPNWRVRVADYETFLSEDLRNFIQEQGIQVIGYRAIQALMPDPAVFAPFIG
jgi:chitin disaccharide deacetylase